MKTYPVNPVLADRLVILIGALFETKVHLLLAVHAARPVEVTE